MLHANYARAPSSQRQLTIVRGAGTCSRVASCMSTSTSRSGAINSRPPLFDGGRRGCRGRPRGVTLLRLLKLLSVAGLGVAPRCPERGLKTLERRGLSICDGGKRRGEEGRGEGISIIRVWRLRAAT